MVGRLGCFMAGCCYGKPTQVAWAVTFTDPAAALNVGTPLGVPLHPTQLYESLAGLVILVVLLATERRGKPYPGRTFWQFVLLYGVSRFVIEFFRGDDRGMAGDVLDLAAHLAGARAAQRGDAVVAARWRAPSQPAAPVVRRRPQSARHDRRRRCSDADDHSGDRVADEHDGLRLDKFLAGELPNHSRAQVQRLIDDGRRAPAAPDGWSRRTAWSAPATP